MDDSFKKAPVSVPKRSGFDKSHQNLLTTKCGTITPILVDELIPGSRVNLKLAISATLPPLASETFMRCSIKTEAFFVPMRLLYGGFESFFTDQAKRYYDQGEPVDLKALLPIIKGSWTSAQAPTWAKKFCEAGSLGDYLGYRSYNPDSIKNRPISAMPFLAYHKIWNDWYRNSLVQRECFLPNAKSSYTDITPTSDEYANSAASAPFDFYPDDSVSHIWGNQSGYGLLLADGLNLYELRQRNFGLDYFTTATPSPQQGAPSSVTFKVDQDTLEGGFSIAALRAANSLQQFKERNNLLGNLFVEQLYGRYGVRPSDGIAQRSLYIGRGEFEVYSKGIYTSASSENGTSNPFAGSPGARMGSAYASGDNFVIDGFEAKEPGYLFVMATLVPRVTYSSGIDRLLTRYTRPGCLTDMANPILQNVGPQPIYEYELDGTTLAGSSGGEGVFGYTDRYADFKIKQDQLHGLVRDGQSLESFALQRNLDGASQGDAIRIDSEFLEIPVDYLDQVSAVSGAISQYGCWMDCFFKYGVSMPLSKYALPTLQDPAYEHGRTIVVSRGGSKL